jgi:hypothetical protein
MTDMIHYKEKQLGGLRYELDKYFWVHRCDTNAFAQSDIRDKEQIP